MSTDSPDSAFAESKQAQVEQFRERFTALQKEIGRVIVGQQETVNRMLTAMVAGGHILLEGVPGLGKTLVVKCFAEALGLSFKRIQCTPDLMPADILGTRMLLDDGHGAMKFEFSKGPVFCNLLLADEINRATPKTQSALLEAMQERSVTIGGTTYPLDLPYFVLATQNPIEQEGTYPLPEAQLDRFTFKLTVNYPSRDEFELIMNRTTGEKMPEIQPAFDGKELVAMGQLAREVPVPELVQSRAIELVMATHPETPYATDSVRRYIRFGASPRAGQAMLLTEKIRALAAGRYHVATEDILAVAEPVLNHRVITNFEAQADGVTIPKLLAELFAEKQKTWV